MEQKQKKILGGAAVALCACYLGGAAFFAGHTYPNTTVDGKDASLLSYTRAQALITAAATEGSLGIRVKDLSYSLHRKDVLGVESRDNWKEALSEGSSFAWPLALFRRHELLSKRTLDVHREEVEKHLEEQGLFELSLPAKDATLSEFSEDAGYSIVPAETGWSANKDEILNLVEQALVSDRTELDLTDTFAVQPAVQTDDAALTEKMNARNLLVRHNFTFFIGPVTQQLDSATLNSWLVETREGATGLDYASIEAYVNGLQDRFTPSLASLSAENGGENYIVDSELTMQILCNKLGINRPARETDAQRRTREAANAKILKQAKRAAKREKNKEKAEQILREAEAKQTPAPELIATLKSEEERAADAENPILIAKLRDGIFIENLPDEAAAEPDLATPSETVRVETVGSDTITIGAAPAESETVESLNPEGQSSEAAESTEPSREAPKSLNGEVVMAKDDIFVPVLAADPEFQLGHGLTYIDISIEKQRVILFENGRKVMESACVTGTPNRERATHYGSFRINYKQRNRILRGSQKLYEAFVSYWMPFDGGIGLHDATWRGSFGGNIYKSNGSHGCINLPPAFAKQLYERVTVGMPVYVH
ncbi:L,D-transpeptidase [Stomatobaculum sp. F0698]|uniref:L,D-transpeptidase n=1 Tax=Stomatobaculum sp. F0698 TaxID=3059030 RepID=UPI00272D2811|nr:L,D-transpeptidase [Stomatobaculum sp. F0698]WLD87200.1 L,D-transpeptidase [Stomatobaculum sp. F0698]